MSRRGPRPSMLPAGLGIIVLGLLTHGCSSNGTGTGDTTRGAGGMDGSGPNGSAASSPSLNPAPRPVAEIADAASGRGRRVLFVGLDGADWELLDRYLAAGAMPNLAGLVSEGRSGILMTLHPPLSPLVWTTMMTGAGPIEHGILDFTRFNPISGAREPITSAERRVPAIWNMATFAGRTVAVFGMWATWPAEPVSGLIVSDRLFSFQNSEARPPPGAIFPAGREAWALRALETTKREIDLAALETYLPWLDRAGYQELLERTDPHAHPESALRRILIETRVYDRLAREWLREERPDLAVVYLQGTDTIGHVFAPYAPPRPPGVSPLEYARYSGVAETYFREIDALLGEYRELARAAGAVLMLASDHGFYWGEGRPTRASSLAAATAGRWHRDEGIYLLWGAGIGPAVREERPAGVSQITPTILSLLGLQPGEGLQGSPLPGVSGPVEAGTGTHGGTVIGTGGEASTAAQGRAGAGGETPTESHRRAGAGSESPAGAPAGAGYGAERVARVDYGAYYRPSHVPPGAATGESADAPAADESLEKLRSLGYIGAGEAVHAPRPSQAHVGPRAAGAPPSTRTPGSFNNEGLIRREHGQSEEAAAAFETAIALDPRLASALWNLSELLFSEGRDAQRSDTLLVKALAEGLPDGVKAVVGRAIACRRSGNIERSLALLRDALAAAPGDPELWLFRGRYRVERRECADALSDFEHAIALDRSRAAAWASSGLARLCLGDRPGAARDFARSLALDPAQPELQRLLAGRD